MRNRETLLIVLICINIALFFNGNPMFKPGFSEEENKSETAYVSDTISTYDLKIEEKYAKEIICAYIDNHGDSLLQTVGVHDIFLYFKDSIISEIGKQEIIEYILCLYINEYGTDVLKKFLKTKTKMNSSTFNKHEIKNSIGTDKPRDW